MATWKKIVLGLLIAGIVTVGGCFALLHDLELFPDMCATTIIDEAASPSGKLKAVVFQIDCGATTGFNSHVSIVPGNKDALEKNILPWSFFLADTDHGRAPAGKGGGPEVRLTWLSEERLEIQHHELARVFRAKKSAKGIAVDYRTFRFQDDHVN